MNRSFAGLVLAASLIGACLGCGAPALDPEYVAEIELHRATREERLRDPGGWLTVAGLSWLEPGENRFGSDPDSEIPLPADAAPAWAGSLILAGDEVSLRLAPDVPISIAGEPATERVLRDDNQEGTDVLELDRLRFHVLRRGDKRGVRVKDPESPRLKEFSGLEFFPLDAGYRLDARLERFDEPREVKIPTVIGTTIDQLAPGTVEFSLNGKKLSLLPLVSEPEDTELWFIFEDETSGKETYGFRYLYANLAGDRVDLDFNRAYNPPCAFTPYATCPLPPKENKLKARVEAGERIYGH